MRPRHPARDAYRHAHELAPEWLPPDLDLSDVDPPTHLPMGTDEQPSVIVGEIGAPLYLDDPTPPAPQLKQKHAAEPDSSTRRKGRTHSRHSYGEGMSLASPGIAVPPPPRRLAKSSSAPHPMPLPPAPSHDEEKSVHVSAHKSAHKRPAGTPAAPVPVVQPAPAPPPPEAAAATAPPPPPSIPGSIDPLQIPTPPELAPVIYSWVRRLALQADLTGADRMLRDALADLTSSLTVQIIYPGADDLFSLGADDEVPKDPTPIIMVAQARRAMIASHTAVIPILTTTDVVAVVLLTRNPRNPAYTPVEQISALALARECASILHHLAVEHIQKQTEIAADKGSLYRGEALEAHRTRGHEGAAIALSPTWVRLAYPILVITLLVALVFCVFIHVPTYSTGQGAIHVDNHKVVAGALSQVFEVLVVPQQKVKKGDPLVKLGAIPEAEAYKSANKEYEIAMYTYLSEPDSDVNRKDAANRWAARDRARRELDNKTVKAPSDGIVADIRIRQGSQLQAGDTILNIVEENAMPEVIAFLPGTDRPRLRPGQKMQLEIAGYTKTREFAEITSVSQEVVGARDALMLLGSEGQDTIKLEGPVTVVHAKLSSRTFITQHSKAYYHVGMTVKTEVKISSKPFIVTMLPALEKYLPD